MNVLECNVRLLQEQEKVGSIAFLVQQNGLSTIFLCKEFTAVSLLIDEKG